MFVDRSVVVSLIDQLVSVPDKDQATADDRRPVLVVEGSGGSGRSTFLRATWNTWAKHTPTAWIDPRSLAEPDATGLRPVLAAVLLGLSAKVPEFRMSFPRVITAYIAMNGPINEPDPKKAAEIMRTRLVEYSSRANLIGLLGGLMGVVGKAAGQAARHAGVPGTEAVPYMVDEVVPRVMDRFRRTSLGLGGTLGAALEWFGDQDRELNWDPLTVLVQLSRQAALKIEAVRLDVDELLVAALLADLRANLSGVVNRPSNALILLDNGDMPIARAFTTALVSVQARPPDPTQKQTVRPPDPVVVVTASGGFLADDLVRTNAPVVRWDGPGSEGGDLPSLQRHGAWLPIQLSDLTEQDVRTMAQTRMWPPALGSGTVSHLTHRLTGGHAAATRLVIDALAANPELINDIGKVLGGPSTDAPATVEDHLLDTIVSGLRASGTVDAALRDDLITLAAARDVAEAKYLTGLLRAPAQGLLLTSSTLWSGRRAAVPPLDAPPSDEPSLSPLVRYLGLRALARRSGGAAPTWDLVFTTLRDQASPTGDDDRAGRLHHELALGGRTLVTAELVDLLPTLPDDEWLALLDDVTATPDPRQTFSTPVNVPTLSTGYADVITRLVEGQHAVSDPQLSDPAGLHYLYSRLSNDFGHLAGNSRVFLRRADHYTHLANALA
ncbi:MAG TPA: hypothetical protein VGL93_35200 [Streptosporangiaceae bacterium]|jgi:hypothetical protein